MVVWGAGGRDKKLSELSRELAKSLANGAPCFADTNMVEGLVDSHNLILVGTAESNLWLAKVSKDLPVRLEQGRLTANGKRYEARDMGYILIYPNPMNPDKYVVVFSATSSAAMAQAERAYSEMKPRRSSDFVEASDVGIFEVTERDEIKWHIMEKFTTAWGWHEHWDQVLAVVNKKHPKWQWRQWVVGAVREQLGVDVAICVDPFKFIDSIPAGEITYRDLFNNFRNDWVIKVNVDGQSLQELLLAPFAEATVCQHIRNAKVIFGHAVRDDLILFNPFDRLKGNASQPDKNWKYVTRDELHQLLEACPSVSWRLLLALCRLAGLRQGEALGLSWSSIDWENRRLEVIAEKTGRRRVVPIEPELYSLLLNAFSAASDCEQSVIPEGSIVRPNLWRDFGVICRRAGLKRWAKWCHVLRKNCETDWAQRYPQYVVSTWLGHGMDVSARYYLQVPDELYEKVAATNTAQTATKTATNRGGAKVGERKCAS